MNKWYQVFAYGVLFIVGALLFIVDANGHIIKICIACRSAFENIVGAVSIITGIAGLVGTIVSKKETLHAGLNANA